MGDESSDSEKVGMRYDTYPRLVFVLVYELIQHEVGYLARHYHLIILMR